MERRDFPERIQKNSIVSVQRGRERPLPEFRRRMKNLSEEEKS